MKNIEPRKPPNPQRNYRQNQARRGLARLEIQVFKKDKEKFDEMIEAAGVRNAFVDILEILYKICYWQLLMWPLLLNFDRLVASSYKMVEIHMSKRLILIT